MIQLKKKNFQQEVLKEKVDAAEVEKERILATWGQLCGSMVERRRVLCTWAVGEAWEWFSQNHAQVVKRAFTTTGLALPIDGSRDSEISVKELNSTLLIEGLKDWGQGRLTMNEEAGEEEELDIAFDELDGEYLVGEAE